ncbi:ADP-ribosylglycohydrolase family protein [candidate division KSB1 bacterium]|nr:ADP-ribosylglycohydrolase family protein [candidate division KSB1 bacterium]
MLTRSEFVQNRELCFDKAYGALIGLAIGDSFGDACRTNENHANYGITMDFREDVTWSTDDTEFTLLTAKMLIEAHGHLTPEHVLKMWQKHVISQGELYRGGASEREAAANIKRGIYPPASGKYNSYSISDGAAMRITPIGIICAGDPTRAAQLAEIDAQISHWRDGIWGAQAIAVAVSIAMVGGTVDDIIAEVFKVVPPDSWFHYSLSKAMRIVNEHESIETAWMPLHTELWTEYKAAVPEAVAQALALFKATNGNFRKGIIYGGNFGRDADTIAAIIGGISGALNGASKIPPRWIEKTRYPSGTCLAFAKGLDISQVAGDLAELLRQASRIEKS